MSQGPIYFQNVIVWFDQMHMYIDLVAPMIGSKGSHPRQMQIENQVVMRTVLPAPFGKAIAESIQQTYEKWNAKHGDRIVVPSLVPPKGDVN